MSDLIDRVNISISHDHGVMELVDLNAGISTVRCNVGKYASNHSL